MKVVISEFRQSVDDMKPGDVAIASNYAEWFVVVKNICNQVVSLDGMRCIDGDGWDIKILDPKEWELCVRKRAYP